MKLIIYLNKDKTVKRVLTLPFRQATDMTKLAKDLCNDCGDNYYGHKVVESSNQNNHL